VIARLVEVTEMDFFDVTW